MRTIVYHTWLIVILPSARRCWPKNSHQEKTLSGNELQITQTATGKAQRCQWCSIYREHKLTVSALQHPCSINSFSSIHINIIPKHSCFRVYSLLL